MEGLENKKIYIIDTSGLILLPSLDFKDSLVITTDSAVKEVYKDPLVREKIESFISTGKLGILKPKREYVKKAVKLSREIGEISRLSKADLDILSLALQFSKYGPIVVTDDYSLQNLLNQLNIEFLPLRRRIRKVVRRWTYRCIKCGKEYKRNIGVCVVCGGEIQRVPIEER